MIRGKIKLLMTGLISSGVLYSALSQVTYAASCYYSENYYVTLVKGVQPLSTSIPTSITALIGLKVISTDKLGNFSWETLQDFQTVDLDLKFNHSYFVTKQILRAGGEYDELDRSRKIVGVDVIYIVKEYGGETRVNRITIDKIEKLDIARGPASDKVRADDLLRQFQSEDFPTNGDEYSVFAITDLWSC